MEPVMPLEVNYPPQRFTSLRPNEPDTSATPGPAVVITNVLTAGLRKSFTLTVDPTNLDTVEAEWGDGTSEMVGGPFPKTVSHTYPDTAVYEIRVIARSTLGRVSVNFFNVQVGTSPVPDPAAEFTISPAAPTDADSVVLTSTSTPEEFIEAWEWGQQMPVVIPPAEGPPVMNLGPQPAGAYVWNLRVRLTDGRWSTLRSRGVNITATEDPEPDPGEPPE
jgi:hypothetical protein